MSDLPSYSRPDCGTIQGAQNHHRADEPLCDLCQRWSDKRHASTRVPAGSRCGTPAGAQMHRQLGEKVCPRCAPGRKPRPPKPPPAHVRAASYTVSCLPEDDVDSHAWAITVEYRGRGLWAVKHFSDVLSHTGEWDYEMRPSAREDEWLAEHRFPLKEALELAKEAAPDVVVNGLTPAGLLAWRAPRRE